MSRAVAHYDRKAAAYNSMTVEGNICFLVVRRAG